MLAYYVEWHINLATLTKNRVQAKIKDAPVRSVLEADAAAAASLRATEGLAPETVGST